VQQGATVKSVLELLRSRHARQLPYSVFRRLAYFLREEPSMFARLCLVTVSLSLLSAWTVLAVQETASEKDMKALQGKWQVVSMSKAGKEAKIANAFKYLVFDGDKIKFMVDAEKEIKAPGRFKVDASKTPNTIDVVEKIGDKDSTGLLIYELQGDSLKLCVSAKFEKERPKAFSSTPDDKQTLIVLKRAK
jgi:uncharacterized protein (TIGR03067 family)